MKTLLQMFLVKRMQIFTYQVQIQTQIQETFVWKVPKPA